MSEYNAKSIKLLKFPDNIRQKAGMYIGSTEQLNNGTNPAIYQITKEVLDNAIDEVLTGNANKIRVEFDSKNQRISVSDNGRGIPVDYHKDFGVSTLIGVFSNMHASGKFDKDSYETSIGTHGCGSKATNALSEKFEVTTYRNKKWYNIKFEKGVLKQDIKEVNVNDWKKGTIINFIPDSSILKGVLDFEKLKETCLIVSYITGVEIEVVNDGVSKIFKTKNGLVDYLPILYKKHKIENLIVQNTFTVKTKGVDLALQWIDKDVSIIESYVNSSQTSDGGTHVKGLNNAISNAFHDSYKRASFDLQDLETGMVCVLSKAVSEVKFNSQTKEKLITKEAEQETYDAIYPELLKWIKANKEFCDDLIQKAEQLKIIRNKNSEDRELLKAIKGKRGRSGLPVGLQFATATSKNWEEKILYIVEGKSAAGGCKRVRDPRIHEICGLRGKIMNAFKDKKSLLESEEVANILKFIGYGSGEWRVGKTVLFADSDVDGCLGPDTKILKLDGTRPTIRQLAENWEKDPNPFEVYSVDKDGNLTVGVARNPRKTRTVEKICEITWNNDTKTICTLDHKWRINEVKNKDKTIVQSEQSYIKAQDLSVGDSIRSVYFDENKNGYFQILNAKYQGKFATAGIVGNSTKCLVHRFVKSLTDTIQKGNNIHHINENKKDNRSENLCLFKTAAEHGKFHRLKYNGSEKHLEDLKNARKRGCYDNESYFMTYNKTEQHKLDIKAAFERGCYEGKSRFISWNKSEEHKKLVIKYNSPENQHKRYISRLKTYYNTIIEKFGKIDEVLWNENRKFLKCSITDYDKVPFEEVLKHASTKTFTLANTPFVKMGTTIEMRAKKVLEYLEKNNLELNEKNYNAVRNLLGKAQHHCTFPTWKLLQQNHTVKEIRIIDKIQDVYCMTVDNYNNFMIDDGFGNGICSSNCQIQSLVLAVLLKVVPDYVKEGRVYICNAPLFAGHSLTKTYYGASLNDLYQQCPKGLKSVTRIKGWGEAPDFLLHDIAFSNKSTFTQIKYDDLQLDSIIKVMGDDITIRKEMLNNLKDNI